MSAPASGETTCTPDHIEHRKEWCFVLTREAIQKRTPPQPVWERDIYGPRSDFYRLVPVVDTMRRWASRWADRNGWLIEGGSEFWSVDGPLSPLEPRYRLRYRIVGLEPVAVGAAR